MIAVHGPRACRLDLSSAFKRFISVSLRTSSSRISPAPRRCSPILIATRSMSSRGASASDLAPDVNFLASSSISPALLANWFVARINPCSAECAEEPENTSAALYSTVKSPAIDWMERHSLTTWAAVNERSLSDVRRLSSAALAAASWADFADRCAAYAATNPPAALTTVAMPIANSYSPTEVNCEVQVGAVQGLDRGSRRPRAPTSWRCH